MLKVISVRYLRYCVMQLNHLLATTVGIFLLLTIFGCGQQDKTKVLEQYNFDESVPVSTELTGKKLEPWVQEGVTCFGILVVLDQNKKPTRIREFMAKIVRLDSTRIKMRSLENVTYKSVKCHIVYGIRKGEFWDEKEGEVFKTREEAISYIDHKYPGLRIK